MIGFFPIPYEDELAYSVFARYHSQSGYLCYSSTARDLYINTNNKPSFEFLNRLTDDAITHIVAISGSLENFIVKHYLVFLYIFLKKIVYKYVPPSTFIFCRSFPESIAIQSLKAKIHMFSKKFKGSNYFCP